MAKSIRSKWKRKCRAIKRVRYGEKELERLKKTLANDPLNHKTEKLEEIANVVTASEIREAAQTEQMDVDGTATAKVKKLKLRRAKRDVKKDARKKIIKKRRKRKGKKGRNSLSLSIE